MDVQAEKLDLIRWITEINDTAIIKEFIALKKSKESDWWNEISEEERLEIEEGIVQADAGEVVPHEKVMDKYKKWL